MKVATLFRRIIYPDPYRQPKLEDDTMFFETQIWGGEYVDNEGNLVTIKEGEGAHNVYFQTEDNAREFLKVNGYEITRVFNSYFKPSQFDKPMRDSLTGLPIVF